MQAGDFIRKWGPGGPAHALTERAGAQAHFIDLCRVLGVPEPGDPDAYCFERGLTKTGSASGRTDGFADVWLTGHFAWEHKAPGKSLDGALRQLMQYALPLESPPLLVVSDRLRIDVHTQFTGTPSERHLLALDEIGRPDGARGLFGDLAVAALGAPRMRVGPQRAQALLHMWLNSRQKAEPLVLRRR